MKTIEVHPNIIFPTRNIFVPKDFAMKQNVRNPALWHDYGA